MVGQSKRRGSTIPVSVDRRWDWLLGQVTLIVDGTTNVLKVASEANFAVEMDEETIHIARYSSYNVSHVQTVQVLAPGTSAATGYPDAEVTSYPQP